MLGQLKILRKRKRGTEAMDAARLRAWRNRVADAIMAPLANYPSQTELVEVLERDPKAGVNKNRRAGGTEAMGRYTLAKAIREDDWTCAIGSATLKAPTRNWLDRKGRPSAVGLMREHGLLPPGGKQSSPYVRIERMLGSIVAITFPLWGSQITVIDVGREDLIPKHDGQTAHLWWFDEAQNIPCLQYVLKELVNPTLIDHGGRITLTGTPGEQVDSYFGQVSQGLAGDWLVVHLASWQNPRFGATFDERWAHIYEHFIKVSRTEYGLADEDVERIRCLSEQQVESIRDGTEGHDLKEWVESLSPSLLREFFGRCVGDYGSLVFAWHRDIYWADSEPGIEGAVAALPTIPGQWNAVLGHDAGATRDANSWVIVVWAHQHPTAYVIYSESEWRRIDDDQALDHTGEILQRCQDAGLQVQGCVADMTGMMMRSAATWDRVLRNRVGIPMQLPSKGAAKLQRIKATNLDLARGHLKVARGGDIDTEGRHLRWHPEKAGVVDKHRKVTINGREVEPGDHCLDALLYAMQLVNAHWQRPPVKPTVETIDQRLDRLFGSDEEEFA